MKQWDSYQVIWQLWNWCAPIISLQNNLYTLHNVRQSQDSHYLQIQVINAKCWLSKTLKMIMYVVYFWTVKHSSHRPQELELHHLDMLQHYYHYSASDDKQDLNGVSVETDLPSGVHNTSGPYSLYLLDNPRCSSLLFLGTKEKHIFKSMNSIKCTI